MALPDQRPKNLNQPFTRTALLAAPLLCAAVWLVRAVKPWETKVFQEELARKDIPLSHYINAGVWVGVLGAALLGGLLMATACWWNRGSATPVRQPVKDNDGMSLRWFWIGMVVILVFATWQRWPAMGHSFWGDEGWAFCDFVHGKWKPDNAESSLQGEMRFEKVRWQQTVFGDRSGNNHWLGSILQRATLAAWQQLTGRSEWDFDERVVRAVPLVAGLGSLLAMGLLGRRLGGSILGLTATALMALHPLHIRFSVKARGYSLMLFFFILALLALVRALENGRRRDWFAFGLLQFLVLYSWKGAIYPVAGLNLALGSWLLFAANPLRGHRSTVVTRWLAANLLGAMIFLPLTISSNLQIAKSIEEVRRRAKPMDANWARDAFAETVLGLPWHEQDKANPHEISLERFRRRQPWVGLAACALVAGIGIGWLRFWKRDCLVSILAGAVFVSGLVAILHFKFVLRVELLTWYLLFNVPLLCLLLARAVTPGLRVMEGTTCDWAGHGRFITASAVAGFALFTLPKTRCFQGLPRENHRRAWELTRGRHEERGYSGQSKVLTAWLWRHTHTYDPRGDTYIRVKEALEPVLDKARLEDGEFYMIVGMRQLSEVLCSDVVSALRDPSRFDHIATLWGVEHLNTLEVYRMRKANSEYTPFSQVKQP